MSLFVIVAYGNCYLSCGTPLKVVLELFDEKNLEFALAPNVCVDLAVLENTVFLEQNVVRNV